MIEWTRPGGGSLATDQRRLFIWGRAVGLLLAAGLVAAACSGERPELISADLVSTSQPADGSAATGPELAATDCVTAPGSAPLQVLVEATPQPTIACGRVAGYQRVSFVNSTTDQINFDLAGVPVVIQPGETYTTDPVGGLLGAGLTQLYAQPHPVSGIWLVDQAESTLTGQQMGLNSFGNASIGMTPTDASAAIGLPLIPDDTGAACYQTSIEGDPYSPVFTVRDGTIASIQVFASSQLTRSEIGVGSAEADVNAAYSAQIETQASPDGNAERSLLVFVPSDEADKQFRLVFIIEGGVVTSMYNGLVDFLATPGCA